MVPPTGPMGPMISRATSAPRASRQMSRYDAVILLDTCARLGLYDGDNSNFCRFEDADAAIASTDFLKHLWSGHAHLHLIDAYPKLDDKIAAVDSLLLRIVD